MNPHLALFVPDVQPPLFLIAAEYDNNTFPPMLPLAPCPMFPTQRRFSHGATCPLSGVLQSCRGRACGPVTALRVCGTPLKTPEAPTTSHCPPSPHTIRTPARLRCHRRSPRSSFDGYQQPRTALLATVAHTPQRPAGSIFSASYTAFIAQTAHHRCALTPHTGRLSGELMCTRAFHIHPHLPDRAAWVRRRWHRRWCRWQQQGQQQCAFVDKNTQWIVVGIAGALSSSMCSLKEGQSTREHTASSHSTILPSSPRRCARGSERACMLCRRTNISGAWQAHARVAGGQPPPNAPHQ